MIKYLFTRRFSLVDAVILMFSAYLFEQGGYLAGGVVFFVGLFVSAVFEYLIVNK